MDIDIRKARVKNLRRILNSLSIEIKELKAKGLRETDDLNQALLLITQFCEKLWPFSDGSSKGSQDVETAQKRFNNRFSSKTGRV